MPCYFCQKNKEEVDFKNTELLRKFTNDIFKIKPRKRTYLCADHQKKVARAIKRARQLGLFPYMPK